MTIAERFFKKESAITSVHAEFQMGYNKGQASVLEKMGARVGL
jgi:hypothetical protein